MKRARHEARERVYRDVVAVRNSRALAGSLQPALSHV